MQSLCFLPFCGTQNFCGVAAVSVYIADQIIALPQHHSVGLFNGIAWRNIFDFIWEIVAVKIVRQIYGAVGCIGFQQDTRIQFRIAQLGLVAWAYRHFIECSVVAHHKVGNAAFAP